MNLKISCPLIAASRKKNATPTSMITLQKMIGMETSYLNNNVREMGGMGDCQPRKSKCVEC